MASIAGAAVMDGEDTPSALEHDLAVPQTERAASARLVVLGHGEELERRRPCVARLEAAVGGAALHDAVRDVAGGQTEGGGVDVLLAAIVQDHVQPVAL